MSSPYSSSRLRRKSGFCASNRASGAGVSEKPGRLRASLRSLACSFRLLRFSRNAADSRSLRAADCSALPGLAIMGIQSTLAAARQQPVRLRLKPPCGKDRRAFSASICRAKGREVRCRSSVVEHSLGKGEVLSSILSGSTIPPHIRNALRAHFIRFQLTSELPPPAEAAATKKDMASPESLNGRACVPPSQLGKVACSTWKTILPPSTL